MAAITKPGRQSLRDAVYGAATEAARDALETYVAREARRSARKAVYCDDIIVSDATWAEYESARDIARRELGFNFDTGDNND